MPQTAYWKYISKPSRKNLVCIEKEEKKKYLKLKYSGIFILFYF